MLENKFESRNHAIKFYKICKNVFEDCTDLDMDFAMKSIKKEDLKFTNYVSSLSSEQYKLLKSIYIDNNNKINILDYFEITEIEIHSKNINRLIDILSYNCLEKNNKKGYDIHF